MPRTIKYTLDHNAEAKAITGVLRLPLSHTIKPQAVSSLAPAGGYVSQHTAAFQAKGIVSYRAAYTQVFGNHDPKPGKGWLTVSTSVVEFLNILEVVTADRVVAQIFTEHPIDGYVPSVSFLGTRFENLRIAGYPVELDYDLAVVGDKNANDLHYTGDGAFMGRMKTLNKRLAAATILPPAMRAEYKAFSLGTVAGLAPEMGKDSETTVCSVVRKATGNFPGKSLGHVIHVPCFGTIHLGTLKVSHAEFKQGVPHKTTFDLTMIDVRMGCLADGDLGVAAAKTNGGKKP